jgi:hypothetical protein
MDNKLSMRSRHDNAYGAGARAGGRLTRVAAATMVGILRLVSGRVATLCGALMRSPQAGWHDHAL